MNTERIKEEFNNILQKSEDYKDFKIGYIFHYKNEDTYEAIAFYDDEIISVFSHTKEIQGLLESLYDYDNEIFGSIEKMNGEIVYMDLDTHCFIWEYINDLYPYDIENKKGMLEYLEYCKKNNITKEVLDKYNEVDNPNAMSCLDKYMKSQEENYFTFVLGYDLLHDVIMISKVKECDINYKYCKMVANNFIESEEYKDTSKSGYEMLEKWLNKNIDKIVKEYYEYIGECGSTSINAKKLKEEKEIR